MTEAIIILALIVANGLFSGAELAVISLRKTRLRELIDEGHARARAVQALRDQPERFLATVQSAITVIGAAAAAFGGDVFAERLARLVAHAGLLAPYAKQIGFALVVGTISFLSLVLGELVPKSLALRSNEGYAMFMGPVLLGLSHISRPFIWILTSASNLVLRLFGDKTSFTETRLSPDELREMVEEAAKTGALDPRAGELAARAIDFRELSVASVMVPRVRVVSISREASAEQLQRALSQHVHTRIPVYEGTADNVVGYVATKDLIVPTLGGEPFTVDKFMRPIRFVPGSVRALDLMHDMQQQRGSIAVVVDEQGGMLGLITIEDLIEELVGKIFSEHDAVANTIQREPSGTALVMGTTPVREVNRALKTELPESEQWHTIAGLCISLAHEIPAQGTRLTASDGSELEIADASPRRVRAVRIHPRKS
ncbi:MAG TPA: hemolysin family protein [Pseudomonadota bacterium]|nr:hemolysin family protein [Pseudomonadota bacterium]